MHGIIQANIKRFKSLLKTEASKRAMLIKLLAEEEAKRIAKAEKANA